MDYLTTEEVAEHLRLKPRKVYDLVRQGHIPCSRVTGKLLFPRQSVDLWVMSHMEGDQALSPPPPPVYAGSSEPLLEWALREAGTDLALLCKGSSDGVQRLRDGHAAVIGLHLVDPETGRFNDPLRLGLGGLRDLVMLRWATRRQGLVAAANNPLGLTGLDDLRRPGLRVVMRQPGAGADALFRHLLGRHGIDADLLDRRDRPALGEDDLAAEIQAGDADCGFAVEASARRHGLHFIPLVEEPFDLAMRRRSYFEPAVQRLVAFAGSAGFRHQAEAMGGYDLGDCARVVYNA